MAVPVVLGAIDLDDQVHYFVDSKGLNLGQMQTTWDEQVSLTGAANTQTNVRRGSLIPVTIPMQVRGSSVANLESYLTALWVEVDKASNTLTVNGTAYNIVYSTRPDTIEIDSLYQLKFIARFVLVLMRKP